MKRKQTIIDYFNQYKTILLLYSTYLGIDQHYDKLVEVVDKGVEDDVKVAARRLFLEIPTNAPKMSSYYVLERIGYGKEYAKSW